MTAEKEKQYLSIFKVSKEKIKNWKRDFEASSGRNPTENDVSSYPQIAICYKNCRKIKCYFKSKSVSLSSQTSPSFSPPVSSSIWGSHVNKASTFKSVLSNEASFRLTPSNSSWSNDTDVKVRTSLKRKKKNSNYSSVSEFFNTMETKDKTCTSFPVLNDPLTRFDPDISLDSSSFVNESSQNSKEMYTYEHRVVNQDLDSRSQNAENTKSSPSSNQSIQSNNKFHFEFDADADEDKYHRTSKSCQGNKTINYISEVSKKKIFRRDIDAEWLDRCEKNSSQIPLSFEGLFSPKAKMMNQNSLTANNESSENESDFILSDTEDNLNYSRKSNSQKENKKETEKNKETEREEESKSKISLNNSLRSPPRKKKKPTDNNCSKVTKNNKVCLKRTPKQNSSKSINVYALGFEESEDEERNPDLIRVFKTNEEKLAETLGGKKANENYRRINLKKKTYVRGKKKLNGAKVRREEWKRKMAAKEKTGKAVELRCSSCKEKGHVREDCIGSYGDRLRPLPNGDQNIDDYEEESKGALTLEEAFYAHENKEELNSLLFALETVENSSGFSCIPPYFSDNTSDFSSVDETLSLFGHSNFREGQREAIISILKGQSTLVLLATGSGKSLIYQIPAYLLASRSPCITLVISPLISLMEDQISGLPSFLKAGCLHRNQSKGQRAKVIQDLKSNSLHFLLLSPEALANGGSFFGSLLSFLPPIAFVTIDEAHCVSQWSHNFRPSYLRLCKILRCKLGVRILLGLTATAPESTILDIRTHMNISADNVLRGSLLRPNLLLSASKERDKDRALLSLLKGRFSNLDSIIIYCTRREECSRLSIFLRTSIVDESKKKSRISSIAEPYHAGLTASKRRSVQKHFMSGATRIIVATLAFGMGIDKSDIRLILHYNLPKSFESYIQEIGRAGRDGLPAYCHLFLSTETGPSDLNELKRHIYSNSIDRHTVRKLLRFLFPPSVIASSEKSDSSKNPESSENLESSKNPESTDNPDSSKNLESIDNPESSKNPESTDNPKSQQNPESSDNPVSELESSSSSYKEVSLSIQKTVEYLDLPEENISTLLCYLESTKEEWIKLHNPMYGHCKIMCYGGMGTLNSLASKSRALSEALNYIKNISNEPISNSFSFPLLEVSERMGISSWILKKELKNLQRFFSNLLVEFNELSFHFDAKTELSENELESIQTYLYSRVQRQEKRQLSGLQRLYRAFYSISSSEESEEYLREKSEKLKAFISEYFSETCEEMTCPTENFVFSTLENENYIRSTLRNFILTHSDNTWTGRSLAKVFHGIGSPNFPAQVWGKVYKSWRSLLNVDFNVLCKIGTEECIGLRNKK